MATRYSKLILVFASALYFSIVVFNNLTDYGTNFAFVSHVMQMDTTFPDNQGKWRAIDIPGLHHAGYALLIGLETVVAVLCWIGGWKLLRAVGAAKAFNAAKGIAVIGLTLGILLFFTGFTTVGGEWFLMWQSATWNGVLAAFRIAGMLGIFLIYLQQPDQDEAS